MRGYRMVLVMPEQPLARAAAVDDGLRRASSSSTPKTGRHGRRARHRREDARRRQGHHPRPVRQSRQSARALPRHGARDLARHRGRDHALRVRDGHDRHDHGRVALPQGEEPGHPDRRRAAGRRRVDPGHPQMARGLPAEDLRRHARRPHRVGHAGGRRGDDAPAGARGRHLRRHLVGRRAARWRCASRARCATRRSCSSCAIAATATCPPACSRRDSRRWCPILVFDIETRARRRRACAGSTTCRASSTTTAWLDVVAQQRRAGDGQRFPAARICSASSPSRARCATTTACACGRSASPTTPSPSSSAASSTASRSYTPQLVSWNGSGFDLPVLHYRALIHGVAAPLATGTGATTTATSSSTTTSAASTRGTSTSWTCSRGYQPRASAPLDAMARLCGFPGKLGMDGSEVAAAVAARRDRRRPQLLRDRRRQHATRSTSASG